MPTSNVKTTQTVTISGPITLGDILDFVNRVGHLAPTTTRIQIKQGKSYSPLDHDPDQISITFSA